MCTRSRYTLSRCVQQHSLDAHPVSQCTACLLVWAWLVQGKRSWKRLCCLPDCLANVSVAFASATAANSQAGRFELRLIDLQAKQAAEAALAAAIASASSALPIAPIPEHLRLGAGGMHVGRGASSRRPASAPPRAHRPVPVSDASSAAAAAAAAAAVPAAGEGAGGSQGAAAAGGPLGASVAAGLDLLQAGLADCPAMGAEGVLASVRVKNGRLVGTQGLAEQLRQQHNVSVPYKVTCADQGTSGLS